MTQCDVCKCEFEKIRSNQKICSSECRQKKKVANSNKTWFKKKHKKTDQQEIDVCDRWIYKEGLWSQQ